MLSMASSAKRQKSVFSPTYLSPRRQISRKDTFPESKKREEKREAKGRRCALRSQRPLFFSFRPPLWPWSVNIDAAEALSINEHGPSAGGINLLASLIGRPCGRFLGALSASHSHEVPYASPYVPSVEEAQEPPLCGEALLAMSHESWSQRTGRERGVGVPQGGSAANHHAAPSPAEL